MMELSVDTRLGTVKLDRLTAAHDVGKAINPLLVEGQIEGGAAQGIGLALMEDYMPGRTENLHDYLIPTFGDMPEVTSIIVEVPDPHGPYGAKGLGEHVLIPTAPAILNAIRDATGASVRHLPATPDKVLAAIRARRQAMASPAAKATRSAAMPARSCATSRQAGPARVTAMPTKTASWCASTRW
jgi:aldehyde oxidoreductase